MLKNSPAIQQEQHKQTTRTTRTTRPNNKNIVARQGKLTRTMTNSRHVHIEMCIRVYKKFATSITRNAGGIDNIEEHLSSKRNKLDVPVYAIKGHLTKTPLAL